VLDHDRVAEVGLDHVVVRHEIDAVDHVVERQHRRHVRALVGLDLVGQLERHLRELAILRDAEVVGVVEARARGLRVDERFVERERRRVLLDVVGEGRDVRRDVLEVARERRLELRVDHGVHGGQRIGSDALPSRRQKPAPKKVADFIQNHPLICPARNVILGQALKFCKFLQERRARDGEKGLHLNDAQAPGLNVPCGVSAVSEGTRSFLRSGSGHAFL
jgi:hypothetical protein